MPSVTVRLFQELRSIAGVGELGITASSVNDVLNEISSRFGERARDLLFNAKGQFREYSLVYVNNQLRSDFAAPLRDGDVVLLIPPAGGGLSDSKLKLRYNSCFGVN